MEKPFGADLASAVSLNSKLHEVFSEDQIFRIDPFPGQGTGAKHPRISLRNGLFVPETIGLGKRAGFYEATGAYRDMVVTHLFQILAFMAMEPPTALEPAPISEEKNKVFRSMLPIEPKDVVRGQYVGYRSEEGVDPKSETETFIALKCSIDNWRWAGVAVLPPHRQEARGRPTDHLYRLPGSGNRPAQLSFFRYSCAIGRRKNLVKKTTGLAPSVLNN